MSRVAVLMATAAALSSSWQTASGMKQGQFVAGSFILTQKSLDEAPYRYAGILRKALDKVETKDPPSKSDEEHCSVRYRITPSGQRSQLRIVDNTLAINLKENNTVLVAAKVYAAVAAKTWIWKGINFGFLGCMKISSCNGEIVTYSGSIDFQIAFQVFWNDDEDNLSILIKPVDTVLTDVNVAGCKPPWYLWWFKEWQKLLNEGVQNAFEEYANSYRHMAQVPQEFSPLPNVFIQYAITDMIWSVDYVVFKANATFSALINGKNETFVPNLNSTSDVPTGNWSLTSSSDSKSHLLQGVRVTTEFLNSLMWYASVSNVTEYRGFARVLDSNINGTISYTPPVIRVKEDNLLTIDIGHGLLLATCLPVDKPGDPPATLFKAEFTDLAGSGKIKLASSRDQTGIKISLDQLDLSRMVTKPFEPKLPLPELFENELMKNVISQLQPVVNQYLDKKPLFLPDSVAPLAASPMLQLFKSGNGTGFAEILSYCTCRTSKDLFTSGSPFAACDPRSHICDGQRRIIEERTPETTTESSFKLGDAVKSGIKSIVDVASKVIDKAKKPKDDDDKDLSADLKPYNFTALFTRSKENFSYVGVSLTLFDNDPYCRLSKVGSSAKVFWLWQTSRCTPLYLHGVVTDEYYFLNATSLSFGCGDAQCSLCQYRVSRSGSEQCNRLGSQSYFFGQPSAKRWLASDPDPMLLGNVYFSPDACAFYPRYLEPQLVSSHTNIGSLKNHVCAAADNGNFVSSHVVNDTLVYSASWDCGQNCVDCQFEVKNATTNSCISYADGVKIEFSLTVFEPGPKIVETVPQTSSNNLAYIGAGAAAVLVLFIMVGIIFLKLRPKAGPKSPDEQKAKSAEGAGSAWKHKLKAFFNRNFGCRFSQYSGSASRKEIREDIIQNLMLLTNGALAIIFAYEWNNDNNPLLIIHDKLNTGVNVSLHVFDTSKVADFASQLNLLTCLVNAINAALSFAIVFIWMVTKTGSRVFWMKARLISAVMLLAGIFIVIAAVIFNTYFDSLVAIERNKGSFLTDNTSMFNMATSVLKVSLNGLSLTVVSFTIVFLFHGVGGGLYCGTVVFRLLHVHSKRENLEILTTLLVILTIIQPFICLHPLIIWSQDSQHSSAFLMLIIIIWFLPIGIHVVTRAVMTHVRPCCESRIKPDANANSDFKQSHSKTKGETRKNRLMIVFDLLVQILLLLFFLATFLAITHYIVNSEFDDKRRHIREFVLPAITAVFFWMASISYFLLSLLLDNSRKDTRLVFEDQNLEAARNMLRNSLRRRLAHMDRSSTLRAHSLMTTRPSQGQAGARQQRARGDQEETISLADVMASKRKTMPVNINLNESLKGRPVAAEDSALVKVRVVNTDKSALNFEGAPANNTKKKVAHFEGINLVPMARSNSKVRKYVQKPDSESEPEAIVSADPAAPSQQDSAISEVSVEVVSKDGFCGRARRLTNFLLETTEYRDPHTYGWRIKFRRVFLTSGVLLFTFLTISVTVSSQNYSSKVEIQKLMDLAGFNLTWPDSGSVLDDVFALYNTMERTKAYIMISSTLLFWAGLAFDFASHFTPNYTRKALFFTCSRVANFFGSLAVFASVIVVGLPDYLKESHLDEICPFCGVDFNETVRQVAEFSIGLFFACLFTFQLIPILLTLVPALVRASVLILIHPSLQMEDNDVTTLRMTILQQVIQVSSFLAFPITFIGAAILQQYQKDIAVTLLIVAFWMLPPLVLFLGLHYTRKYRRYTILLYVYYLYNCVYISILATILFYSLTLRRIVDLLEDLVKEPTFWTSSLAQIFLCNVVISDMLYMTVF